MGNVCIATPENRYLSNLITNTLNELAENQIDLAQAQRLFNLLENEVYDPKQKDVLLLLEKLADKIEQRKVSMRPYVLTVDDQQSIRTAIREGGNI